MGDEQQKNNIETKENKCFKTFAFECKVLPDKEDVDYFYFEGYLSTYGNIDRVDDIMVKGCFDETLKNLKPDLLFMHQHNAVIGVFEEIKSDSKGLFVQGKLPKADTLVSGRVIPQMKIGSVASMSIGYWVQESDFDDDGIRHIKKCVLFEGSLVSQPANEKAEITAIKSFDIEQVEKIKTKRDFEKLLRDSNCFSNKSVVYLASRFKEEKQSESVSSGSIDELINELDNFTQTLNGAKK